MRVCKNRHHASDGGGDKKLNKKRHMFGEKPRNFQNLGFWTEKSGFLLKQKTKHSTFQLAEILLFKK